MNALTKFFLFSFLFFTARPFTYCQIQYDYGFKKDFSVYTTASNGNPLVFAWAGGMNSCHFSELDLNLDSINDMVAFDKTGNKVLTFINNNLPDSISYSYDPYYQKFFPALNGWAHFVDYNNDQKNDIFTYVPGGIAVYKNISDTILKFQLIYPMLNSDMGSSSSNIMVTNDDYPAIHDLDGDGDLDILVFFGLGTFLEMHQNLSQELTGTNDTLLYELSYHCWGDFAESSLDNTLSLNVPCPWRNDTVDPDKATRHVGSTMLANDFNGDGLVDMILGDVDYFNLIKLTNGGTADSAHMVSQDTLFPSNTTPVNFNSFPVASYLDVNNDGKKDLLVSPFSSVYALAENTRSIWYYKNNGTATIPVFDYVKSDFWQGDMIEVGTGAYPVIYDYNGDGLQDIIIGNYGYMDSSYYEFGYLKAVFCSQIAVLENTGTASNPAFRLVTNDYGSLSALKLIGLLPTFGDVDDDGDMDMICGVSDGSLLYFRNNAGAGNLPLYDTPVFNYQSIDVGTYSAPQLFDLNNDSLLDLAIGNKTGLLSYYQNTGTNTNPVFTKITDSLGKVNVTDPDISVHGYSTPCFFNNSNKIKLFSGSETGRIFYYKDVESNLNGKFTAYDSILIFVDKDSATRYISEGMRSGVAVYDLNNDGYKDIITGNFAGGLCFYYGTKPQAASGIGKPLPQEHPGFTIYPNPANSFIKIEFHKAMETNAFVEIFDIIGHRVYAENLPSLQSTQIDISFLNSGFYTATISLPTGQKNLRRLGSSKFIIAR